MQTHIRTLGELRASGYTERSIHTEIRENLIAKMRTREARFPGVLGYDHSVLPQVETALLAEHNILLLGLRGQAKTRIARGFVDLLDAYIPMLEDAPIPDSPFNPITTEGKKSVADKGDQAPIRWLSAQERYVEKLATPDVSVADLIGDIDPIKASSLGLPYSDERCMHFGLIPNSNKSIFVINELPDLQARIQVALFDILSEGDIQIRGFKRRLPLDIVFVFTANPEDYTNRGNIITPLKDRIESQILTHYPHSIEISKHISKQEAKISAQQLENVSVSDAMHTLIEEIAIEARESAYIDVKSGVSARLSIAAYELLHAAVERRSIMGSLGKSEARPSDVFSILPALSGKMELVYEGEQLGAEQVSIQIVQSAILKQFKRYFPDPKALQKKSEESVYVEVIDWFESGNTLRLNVFDTDAERNLALQSVQGLANLVFDFTPAKTLSEQVLYMELCVLGLAASGKLSTMFDSGNVMIGDPLRSALGGEDIDINDLL